MVNCSLFCIGVSIKFLLCFLLFHRLFLPMKAYSYSYFILMSHTAWLYLVTMVAESPRQDTIKQELESELSLPTSDIRSAPWFHGAIARQVAEKLVKHTGDFLVRESLSQPGTLHILL